MRRRALLAAGGAVLFTTARGSAGPVAIGVVEPARPIVVGVLDGPHAEIMQVVAGVVADAGLRLQLATRDAGRGINADLVAGRLDVACFQDGVSFADDAARQPGTLVEATPTVTLPFALYSRRPGSAQRLAAGAAIGLPREPGALARALVLLHDHGLIELRADSGLHATLQDVARRRFGFTLVPLPSAQLPAALDRLGAAVIDMPNAERAGLQPARDGIGIEDARSPWADVMAVRAGDRDTPWVSALVASYRSEPVKRFILSRFQDSVRRPW